MENEEISQTIFDADLLLWAAAAGLELNSAISHVALNAQEES